jgi:hypothetical protein
MVKLIQKSGYIKSDGAGGYMEYIGTRERVEKLKGSGPATENQMALIENLLQDFPETKDLAEYEDYCAAPTSGTASTLISAALDANAHEVAGREGYMKYIATRPRVERHREHGLFSNRPVSLDASLKEIEEHPGNVWTFIWSLHREDAARLGYDHADSWQKLIRAHQVEIAEAMKIPPDQLRWCAAFHDEGGHPHVHAMVWSADPKRGHLTREGINTIRSRLTNDIFRDDLYSLYQEKDISYKELISATSQSMHELIAKMQSTVCNSPAVGEKMLALSQSLETAKGKKVYGYRKKSTKAQVDDIIDELAQLSAVAECYAAWNKLRNELESYYKDTPRQYLPLSQQKEFRAIKNLVIQEAENLRQKIFTFEDADMVEKYADVVPESNDYNAVLDYYHSVETLDADNVTQAENREALQTLEQLWASGFTMAAHHLGRAWRDGLGVLPDDKEAEFWFRQSAEAGIACSQYALGTLLQEQGRAEEAMSWYTKAADAGNQTAQYRLGKLYLQGEVIPKDVTKAVEYLTAAADQGHQYAQYALGKLYLANDEIPLDKEQATCWLTQSASQGNQYAQFLLDHQNNNQSPSVLLSATHLLHHMSQIFQETPPPSNPAGQHVDSKLMKRIREKKIAAGHKPDDHEEPSQGPVMSM